MSKVQIEKWFKENNLDPSKDEAWELLQNQIRASYVEMQKFVGHDEYTLFEHEPPAVGEQYEVAEVRKTPKMYAVKLVKIKRRPTKRAPDEGQAAQ